MTFLKRLTPAVVLVSKYGKLSVGGSSLSRSSNGLASFTFLLVFGCSLRYQLGFLSYDIEVGNRI